VTGQTTDALCRHIFGRSSEKPDPAQLRLFDPTAAQRAKLALEGELLARGVKGDGAEYLVEEPLEEFGGTFGVGAGKRRAALGSGHTGVLELALAAAPTGVDPAQAARSGEMAEEHGAEVVPTAEFLAAALAAGVAHQSGETAPVDGRKELAAKAGGG
jgi:hypothetical protein